jgi:valyl-tRNA synthetase
MEPKIKEKHWSPDLELEIQKIWQETGLYKFSRRKGKVFSIDTPPPYASGKWHIAAAIHYAQIDMIARTMRMMGYDVYFPFGVDRNGLPVEVEVEKKNGINMFSTPREEFLRLCKEYLDEAEKDIISISKRLGLSADFDSYFQTDSVLWRTQTQRTFIEAFKKGLVYEDVRPNNYCPRCRTTLADAEVEYKEMESILVYLRFSEKESRRSVVIATTRPELLPACAAVIYNPKDDRYKDLLGKTLITPLGDEVIVLEHPSADPNFGTGIMMVCSYGDYDDVRLFRELGLKPKIIMNEDGTLNELAGKYAGMRTDEARKAILEDLKDYIEKAEKILHRTPVCWRCKTPIEIVPMKEYYLKQKDFLDELKQKVLSKAKFYPEWSVNYWLDWVNSIETDWPISRRRYYGTEIPVWYCKSCGKPALPEPGGYYKPWKEDPPFDTCPHCGSKAGFVGEDRVFDTWMDSSISPLVYNGYGWNEELFKELGQSDLRPQGKDIVRTWLHYTLLRTYHATGEPAFKHIWLSGMGLDANGRPMHKSLGNIIYPWPLLEKYGADAIRLAGASEAHHGSDFRISEARIAGAFKFLQKLWNVSRFISSFPFPEKASLSPTDIWILGELNKTVEIALEGYKKFDFFDPATSARHFIWEVFAPHYVEMVKWRAYGQGSEEEAISAWWTLHTSLRYILRILAPITPHITDVIWRRIYGGTVHEESLPEPKKEWKTDYAKLGDRLMEFNSYVWKIKKERGISFKESVSLSIPEELKPFEKDLRALHNIK